MPCVDGSELARENFASHAGRCSHVFGLLVRFIRTLAINALRGSGPSQKHAFEHAMALVGCPMFRDREWRGLSY